ncbi:fimbria/pilus periplasmic chaperone [Chromobacterium haemolyticum]|uniref:fimbria/pilus periplasmic chaperone n=1 Tax=Chromobacterium haemolyticum TaxID=394935 RepID=UPI00295366B1|nr:fimbria/pilus periplasmic chaperone [Chromobacterium haemolyticum]WON84963.1 fimbria/pilus periplasmic chaperone [Chromobacterium haemolyticum]
MIKIMPMLFFVFVNVVLAAGMQPETTLVLLDETDGSGSILVKNTDNYPLLLYSKIENLPERNEKDVMIMLTPPVARVEPGDQQQVRFMLVNKKGLQTQQMKRVILKGFLKVPQETLHKWLFLYVRTYH